MTEVNFERLREEIEWWIERQKTSAPVTELAGAAGVTERRISGIRAGERCSVDTADKILDAIGYVYGPKRHPETGRLIAQAIKWSKPNLKVRGDQVGRLKTIDFKNAKLTYADLRKVHEAHWKLGLSLREISRRYWKRWGYASEKSCLSSLCDRMKSAELTVRTREEGNALANGRRRIRGADETKAQYRARKRREAREADPAVAEAQRQRIEMLRARHDRRREEVEEAA